MRRLFLDDIRVPTDCLEYMLKNTEIYSEDWDVVRNYNDFVEYIVKYGVPDVVSFDHDLADEVNLKEKTGYDCAKWLCEYCIENSIPVPEFYVHSMNPVGRDNIISVLKTCKKLMDLTGVN